MANFMANRYSCLIPMMACVILCRTMQAAAVTHIVGDDNGWNLGGNYTTWAQGKQFNVGDTLVFNYPVGAHNVYRVDGAGFKTCSKETNLGGFTSGNDKIELTTAGRYWFICAVGEHCANGMKLVITVAAGAPAPAPAGAFQT